MPTERLQQADTTSMRDIDQTTQIDTDFRRQVPVAEQDRPGTRYNPDWAKWFGYYKTVPMLQAVINKKAVWTLGKGYEASASTKKVLDKIRGCGKDTFNTIMFNNIVTYTACGDSFAEIIKSPRGELRNLKPINPGSMTVISNDKGIITGYEQTVIPMTGKKADPIKFKPEKIFHLPWNRLTDECHGRSTIEKLIDIIDASQEIFKDLRIVFHRYVKPLLITKVDSDDEAEIAAFKAKLDNAVKNMENLIVPLGTVAEIERVSIPQYSTLDPLPWIQQLDRAFIIAEGVPEVILGHGKETTEASSKVMYLAFQQNIEHAQRFVEEQIKAQLKLDVEYNFPESLAPDIQETQGKARKLNNPDPQGKKPKLKEAA